MNILDSIHWIKSSWDKVTVKTIQNCWTHAGHQSIMPPVVTKSPKASTSAQASATDGGDSDEDDDEDDLPLGQLKALLESREALKAFSPSDILESDENIPTSEELSDDNWEHELLESYIQEQEPDQPDDEEIELQDEQNEKRVIKSKKELRTLLDEYEYYIIEQEPDLMGAFKQFQTAFLDNSKTVCRQTTLHSFFRTLDH